MLLSMLAIGISIWRPIITAEASEPPPGYVPTYYILGF
jgi:hypothetical protein